MSIDIILERLPEDSAHSLRKSIHKPLPIHHYEFDQISKDDLASSIGETLFNAKIIPEPKSFPYNKMVLFQLDKSLRKFMRKISPEILDAFADFPTHALTFFGGLGNYQALENAISKGTITSEHRASKVRNQYERLISLNADEIISENIYHGIKFIQGIHQLNREQREIYRSESNTPQFSTIDEEVKNNLPPHLGHFMYSPGPTSESRPFIEESAAKGGSKELGVKFGYFEAHLSRGREANDQAYLDEVKLAIDNEVDGMNAAQLRWLDTKARAQNVIAYLKEKETLTSGSQQELSLDFP